MKKIIVIALLIILLLMVSTISFANNAVKVEEANQNNMIEKREKIASKVDEYTEKYGSESYGVAAYVLHIARIYSIPICFVGIIVGALNQYVLGTRRLDKKHKGYGLIMTFVTLLVICQVLPLIFTVVVMGWRG